MVSNVLGIPSYQLSRVSAEAVLLVLEEGDLEVLELQFILPSYCSWDKVERRC